MSAGTVDGPTGAVVGTLLVVDDEANRVPSRAGSVADGGLRADVTKPARLRAGGVD
jgi:hypothetical protein